MKNEPTLPGEPAVGVAAGIMFGSAVFSGLSFLLFKIPYPAKMEHYLEHLKGWAALRANGFDPNLAQESANVYANFLGQLPSHWPLVVSAKFDLAAVAGAVACLALAYAVGKDQPAVVHVKGRRLLAGPDAIRLLKHVSTRQCKQSGQGVKMHHGFLWHLSLQREASHFWVFGSVGSGKTQIISSLMRQAIDRGDKLIVFDNKGDFTRWLPKITLIAPWDERSFAWDIARDCVNAQHARELAAHFIKEGKEAIWHESARQVLTAMIMELQQTQPLTWSWRSLLELSCAPMEQVNGWLLKHVPQARRIAESSGKTVDSIMINFSASLGLISNLAQAWGNTPVERRFSFREWLLDDKHPRKTIVLQGNEDYADLAKSYLQAILSMLSKQINSPAFTESKTRKIWFFLDEFPQLHELKDFAPLLEIGRSKGIRVVLGAQDISQVREIYGHDVASSWMSLVGTVVVAKIKGGETATFIAEEMLGEQTVERTSFFDGKRQPPQRERRLLMEPFQLDDDLGRLDNGIRALLIGFGDAAIVDWPFTDLPQIRQPSKPANWLNDRPEPGLSSPGNDVVPAPPGPTETTATPVPAETAPPPRLKLRPLTPYELSDMASSGTDLGKAADDQIDLTPSPMGGNHEPQ